MRSFTKAGVGARIGRVAFSLAAAALIAGAFGACNNDYGIYASIQQETPGSTSGPFYKTSVAKVLKFAVDSKFYAQRSTLASSADGTTNWTTVSIGSFGTNYACIGFGATTTALWAVIDGAGLYTSTNGSTWTQAIADPTSNQTNSPMIDNLFVAGNTVFIEYHNELGTTSTSTDDTYSLATVSGTTPTAVTLSGISTNTSITGIAYDGTNYWITTTSGVYSAGSSAGPFALDSSAPSGKLDSIAASGSAGTIYVGSDAGYAYKHTGSGWTASPALTYAVTALTEVPVATSVSSGGFVLLAGLGANSSTLSSSSINYGYVQIDPANFTATPVGGESSAIVNGNSTNYDITLLYKPVNDFYFDGASGRLFAGTASANISGATGLFTATVSGTTWSGWSTE